MRVGAIVGRGIGQLRIGAAVARFGRYIFLSSSLYRRMAVAYRSNDFCVTALGQMIPTVRIFMPLPGVSLLAREAE